MPFTDEQLEYEEMYERARKHLRMLNTRLEPLRRQVKVLERSFVKYVNLKRALEDEMVEVKIIPPGVTKKKSEKAAAELTARVKAGSKAELRAMIEMMKEKL